MREQKQLYSSSKFTLSAQEVSLLTKLDPESMFYLLGSNPVQGLGAVLECKGAERNCLTKLATKAGISIETQEFI